MEISTYSPTRVDLAGGTLDLWPLYNFLEEDPITINLGIDIFSKAKIVARDDSKIILSSKDMDFTKSFDSFSELAVDTDSKTALLRLMVLHFKPEKGFSLFTESQSPVGAGLGGSSSLCISIIKAFLKFLNLHLEADEMVQLAHNIESKLLKTPTGTQDYFPPIHGGLLALTYGAQSILTEHIVCPPQVFEDHFLLVYTGKPHHSGMNNWQVMKDIIDGNSVTLDHFKSLSKVSTQMYNLVKSQDWESIDDLFKEEFFYRCAISPVFAGQQILELRDFVMSRGASSVKICGAGGGGCVIVWCKESNKAKLKSEISKTQFLVLDAKPYFYDSKSDTNGN